MKNLNNLSFEQIKNNRFLSATSMISIMLVVFAIVVMFNFALNSIITYPQSFANMKSAGAAIDIRSEEYRKNLLSFIIILSVIVISIMTVTILFITSTFQILLKKSHRDMAILRAMGADKAQIKAIIKNQVNFLTIAGSVLGLVSAFLFYNFGLEFLRKVWGMKINGKHHFYVTISIAIVIILMVIIRKSVLFSANKYSNVMPIEIINGLYGEKNGKEKMRKRRALSFRDLNLSLKLIGNKLSENKRIILSVSLLIVLFLSGNTFVKTVEKNGADYIKQKYKSDVLITIDSSEPLKKRETDKIIDRLKKTENVDIAVMYGIQSISNSDGSRINFQLGDLNGLNKFKFLHNRFEKNETAISDTFAKKNNLKENDKLMLGDKKFTVREIFKSSNFTWSDVIIDADNEEYTDEDLGHFDAIYAKGNMKQINKTLASLKNKYHYIKWSTQDEELSKLYNGGKERFGMFFITLYGLVIIVTIGWINTMNNILEDRRNNYSTLHTLGYVPRRIAMIILYQLLIYVGTGVIGGLILSTILNYKITETLEFAGSLQAVGLYTLVILVAMLPKVLKLAYTYNQDILKE